MLDSLSRSQKIAYDALELGPVWLSRNQSVGDVEVNNLASGEKVALALVFNGSSSARSDAQTQLLVQLLRPLGRNLEKAHFCELEALHASNSYELVLLFGAGSSSEIDSFMTVQGIQIESRVDLQSLAAIAADGKAKALAWKSLKKILL
jgi:hypothetical protein